MRIDAHVHCFPDRLALAVRDRLNQRGGLTAGPLLPDIAARVRAEGFDAAWILPYAHRPGVAESCNEWSAAEVTRYEHLVPGATFHPGDEDLKRLVRRALVELRLRVVKLHCSVGQFSPADPRLAPLWETAAEHGIPIVIHAGQVHGGDTAAGEARELEPVLARYPALPVIAAHCGHPSEAAVIELMARFPNLYADLTPVWESRIEVSAPDLERFAGRILFGSDAPNNPTPATDQLAAWERTAVSASAIAALIGGAAEALIPLQPNAAD